MAKTIAALEPFFDDIMIIGGDTDLYGAFGRTCRGDLLPGRGSLVGIHAALSHARHELVFCIACDMPFVRGTVISLLLERAKQGADAVVPRLKPGLEPLCAVYRSSLRETIENRLSEGELRVRAVFDDCRTLYVEEKELRVLDPDLVSFVNINTPQDLERARGTGAGS